MDDRSSDGLYGLAALADPRAYAAEADADDVRASRLARAAHGADRVAELFALADDGLAASTSAGEEALRARMAGALKAAIRNGDGSTLARAIERAPSLAIARYLWRALETADTDPRIDAAGSGATLATTLFALPLVIVAAADATPRVVSAVIRERALLAAPLREHRAFGACETFALAGTLATTETIGLARLPALLAASKPDVPGTELRLDGDGERVFLRFVVGALLAAPGVDPLRSDDTGAWGAPLARALEADLAAPAVTLLALPRPPRRLVTALRNGRAAQREVAAQLFASNAIRKFRARVGEPTAIISAHRAADAPGGGELRVSLSSPFDPREAEGLRVALYPCEAAGDVATMLVDLLADCGVADIRVEPGVQPDLDPATGLRRFVKDGGAWIGPDAAH